VVWLPVRGMYVGTKGQPHKLPENIAEIPPQTKWRRSKWSVHLMGSVLPGISFPMWTDTVHTRDQFSHNVRYSRREQVLFTIRDQFSQTRDILTMWTGTYKYLHCSHQAHNLSYHVNRYLQAHIQYCASTTCETDYWCNFESCTKPDTYVYIEGYFNWNHKGATICGRGVIYTDAPVWASWDDVWDYWIVLCIWYKYYQYRTYWILGGGERPAKDLTSSYVWTLNWR
jgi:hypothetical protein